MITALYLGLGGAGEEAVRYLLHHRSGLTTAAAGIALAVGHHVRKRFVHTGRHLRKAVTA